LKRRSLNCPDEQFKSFFPPRTWLLLGQHNPYCPLFLREHGSSLRHNFSAFLLQKHEQFKPLLFWNIVIFEKIIFEQVAFKNCSWAIYFHPFCLWMKKIIQEKTPNKLSNFCVVGLRNFAYEHQNFVLNKQF